MIEEMMVIWQKATTKNNDAQPPLNRVILGAKNGD